MVIDPAATIDPTTQGLGEAIHTADLPARIPAVGRIRVPVATWAAGERDLTVDLLVDGTTWHGGGRVRVPAGRWQGLASVDIPTAIPLGTVLGWNALLVPPGGDWHGATAQGTVMPATVDAALVGESLDQDTPTRAHNRCGMGTSLAALVILAGSLLAFRRSSERRVVPPITPTDSAP